MSVVRELEECVVSLQREKQEEAEVHHEELRTALDRGEEHQQRWGGEGRTVLGRGEEHQQRWGGEGRGGLR